MANEGLGYIALVASASTAGSQSKMTRSGIAVAGEQHTVVTTERILRFKKAMDDLCLFREAMMLAPERHTEGYERPRSSIAMLRLMRFCRSSRCAQVYFGGKRQICPHCEWH